MSNLEATEILDREAFFELSEAERRARNMHALQELGEVHTNLKSYVPNSKLVVHENGEQDVIFRGEYLYHGEGAQTYTAKQLEEFWQKPVQINTGFVTGLDLDRHTVDFAERFAKALDEQGIVIDEGLVSKSTSSFFLFVMGVGLCPHFDELIEKTDCRVLAIIDSNYEFLYHSLSTFDWASLIQRFKNEKRVLLVTVNSDPYGIQSAVQSAIRQFNPSGLDGTYIYTHYSNAVFQKAHHELMTGGIKVGMMGLGFLWDEMRMIAHTYKNLETGTARVIKKVGQRLDIPAFVVGAGPSLDDSIDFIKKYKDDAVILACGSALDPLLVNGIYPDVLLMLEQAKGLLDDQKESLKLADTSDIIFVGASNIYPGVMNFHKDRILFFRPGLSTCPLFSQKEDQRPIGADPLVANAGLMFALFGGFRDIYMFGVDVGAPSQEYHHSKHSQYSLRGIQYEHTFTEHGRGNFGGEVLSTPLLLWSKKSLEGLLSTDGQGKKVYNCSNGLLIRGALPRHQSTVEIQPVENKKEKVRELLERFPHYEVEDFRNAWDDVNILENLPKFSEALIACMDEDLSSYHFMQVMMKHLVPGTNKYTVPMVIRGTVFNILIVLYSAMRRLEDPDRMEDFQDVCRTVFAESLRDFVAECDEWFTSLVDGTMEWDT